jgi:hypothetical protein
MTVIAATPALPPSTLGNVPGCRVFSMSFNIGVPGTVYTFTGTLPPGLSLNSSTGVLSGKPTSYGMFAFTIYATPPFGGTVGHHGYVYTEGLCINPISGNVPAATRGHAYSFTMTASGGTAPYRFQLQNTILPQGLTLSQGGLISGTPTGPAGTFTFTVYVGDSSQPVKSGVATFTIVIN